MHRNLDRLYMRAQGWTRYTGIRGRLAVVIVDTVGWINRP